MAQDPLITRRDVLNHGAGNDFLDGFKVRPIEVQIVTAGALGVMTAQWRPVGATDWSNAEPSESGASWTWDAPDDASASIVFTARAYSAGEAWTIATDGTVTAQGVSGGGVTATRYDLVAITCVRVTSDIATWLQPRCVPPIISLGEGQKGAGADLVIYRLASRRGLQPKGAGAGDDNLRMRADDAERLFRGIGASAQRPPDIVDSSAGSGAGLSLLPLGDDLRGWNC